MWWSIIFVILAITFGRSLSQNSTVDSVQNASIERESQDAQSQGAGYVMDAKPFLEYLAILQRVESCEAKQPADTQLKIVQMEEKLEILGRQLAIQQELIKISQTADALSKLALMDQKLEDLRKQMATKQELEKSSQQSADSLEALKNQTATQQELEKTSKQSAETLSAMAQMEEKLEDLRNQTAAQQESQSRLLRLYHSDYFEKIGSKYYYIEKEVMLNWHDALKKCHEMGAHLVSLQSRKELKAVGGVLDVLRKYWTDLNALETEGEFRSATTSTHGFYWFKDELNKYENSENCVITFNSSKGSFIMYEDCNNNYNFICEASFD